MKKLHIYLIYSALVLAILVAFELVASCDFVSYDDFQYVCGNLQVQSGLTLDSVLWAFTTSYKSNWHPLTWLSYMLDFELFGLSPFWYHFVNLLFHIANTLLLFEIFRRMTGLLWHSAFVAALFALHPVHVESVAWVAERKDVLSGLFWMLTIAAYLWYIRRPSLISYLLVLLVFCLGLMAKPMLVTLPFVLLLLDYWPLGRLGRAGQKQNESSIYAEPAGPDKHTVSLSGLILEKIPLFILSAAVIVVTFAIQKGGKAMAPISAFGLRFRLSNALVSCVRYIGKTIYPTRLAVLYPLRLEGLPVWQPIVSFILLAVISVAVFYSVRKRPFFLTGWLWFLITLVPVIGLVQVGIQAMADRYTYLSSIGLFIMITWGAAEGANKWRHGTIALKVSSLVVLVILAILTHKQVGYWQNDYTLYKRAVEATDDNYIMHNNFGDVLLKTGRVDEAMTHFEEALRINPQHFEARLNLGVALSRLNCAEEAVECFKEVLRFRQWPVAYNNLGRAYALLGEYDLAIQNYKEAVRLKPDYPAALKNLEEAQKDKNSEIKAKNEYQKKLISR
ncbi:MAG TPA: tetratricopeptide repeat protein [Planctomycetes bacterium]|nr:tetratricopeptide repeat protein [Planctomycetota bacterium]